MRRGTLAIVLALVAIGCGRGATDRAGEERARIDSLRARYIEAYESHDAKTLVGLHSRDFVEFVPGAQIDRFVIGRATPPAGASLSLEPERVVVAGSGDVAWETGTSLLAGTTPDGAGMRREWNYMIGWEKIAGEWKLDRMALAPGPP
ncbi:MAG: nuclear transport factor 2 family protein [Gemmatimonadota bacterium]|nr:nuclear transport factor 2 family protein [Gemmatimonadota bacterium]